MMTSGLVSFGLVLVAYLLGSIPTGYLVGLYLKGIDIREYGSGSIGATNVLRTLGKGAAITVLLIDLLKGMIAVGLVKAIYIANIPALLPANWQPWLIILTGLVVIIGHSKSMWINFQGGKSAATGLGVLFVMTPWIALTSLGVFVLVVLLSRFVSLGSIAAAIAVNILMLAWQQPLPYILFAAVAGIYVIIRHKSNIERLIAGSEPQLGQNLPQQES